jgi:hypothetical protein
MFVDEAGIDNREDYPYGYCKIGQRFPALKSGKRTERVSWIAALCQHQLMAPLDLCRLMQSRLIRAVVRAGFAASVATGDGDCD